MGCFEDYMQFRDDVDEVRKKIQGLGAGNECRCKEDLLNNEGNIC